MYKKLYAQYGKYSVYKVNAEEIRNESLHREEFGEYGTHLLYPQFIPENEIWIDKNLTEEDTIAVIKNALTQLKDREAGINKHKAYMNGLKVEKAERDKLSGMHLAQRKPLPNKIPAGIFIKLLTIIPAPQDNKDEAVEVWIVNSQYVRNLYQTTFTEGSNGFAASFYVPQNQIWIDNEVDPNERPYILIHEYTERYLMKFKHMKYKEAHKLASRVEFKWRQQGIQLYNLEHELSPEWAAQQVKIIK